MTYRESVAEEIKPLKEGRETRSELPNCRADLAFSASPPGTRRAQGCPGLVGEAWKCLGPCTTTSLGHLPRPPQEDFKLVLKTGWAQEKATVLQLWADHSLATRQSFLGDISASATESLFLPPAGLSGPYLRPGFSLHEQSLQSLHYLPSFLAPRICSIFSFPPLLNTEGFSFIHLLTIFCPKFATCKIKRWTTTWEMLCVTGITMNSSSQDMKNSTTVIDITKQKNEQKIWMDGS